MWSGPRNISTAMMRAWENRGDTFVWDEPLYAFYLQHGGVDHPLGAQVIAAGEPDWRKVVERLQGGAPDGAGVFFQKHMTHHLLPAVERDWLDNVVNCFLIRDPREVIASYFKARAEVTVEDVGIPQQAEIFEYVRARATTSPVVLDARDVLENPRGILQKLCAAVGVAFDERMLKWPAGSRASDGVWARHWYSKVHSSTGFAPYAKKGADLPAELEPLVAVCEPYYHALYAVRLRP